MENTNKTEQTAAQATTGELTRDRAADDLFEVAQRLERLAKRIADFAIPNCSEPSTMSGLARIVMTVMQELNGTQQTNTNTLLHLLETLNYNIEKGVK